MAAARPGDANTNGHTKSQTNGSIVKGSKTLKGVNGHASTGSRRTPKQRSSPGLLVRLFHTAARLSMWYMIISVVFRCPSSLEACDESSPLICKPYFQLKGAVSPHLTPYYDTYAAPYVDIARPYYDTVDRVVISPSRTYAVKYGGPRLAQAQAYGQAQWEKQVQPQLIKGQTLVKDKYDQSVSPYVEKASTVLRPYYDIAKTNALQSYHELVLPTYAFVQPYAVQGYNTAYIFTKDTAVPSTVWAWDKTYIFLDSAIWPRLHDAYTATVEPQLVRIRERLGRYNRKTKSAAEDVASAITKSGFAKPSSSASSYSSAISSSLSEASTKAESAFTASKAPESQDTKSADVNVGPKSPRTPDDVRELAAKTVAEDLELWQGKFSKAIEDGATEIEERVDDIAARMLDHHSAMGKSLVAQLEETVKSELSQLRSTILATLEKGGDDTDKIEEQVVAAIRAAGLVIKNKAQDVRTWRQSYEQETEIAVTKAAQEHFEIIHRTRDLAFQKIGMKWAWMDGITYQHWKQYHALRAQFEQWTEELKSMVTSHPGLVSAQKAGTDVEDEAMAIAQEAAEELARLKKVASWKAIAHDYSDNFDTETIRLAAEAAQQKVTEAAKDAAEGVEEAAESVTEKVKEGVESISEEVENDSPSASSASSEIDTDTENGEPLATSDPVDGPEQIQETIIETPDGPDSAEETEGAFVDTASVKSALFGAAAQAVPSRQPILDDDFIDSASSSLSSAASVVRSDVPDSITSAAQSAYTAALAKAADQYSHAMSAVSVQISGEPKPAHEELFSSVSSAYFGAVAAANSHLTEAATAASQSIYGTPTAQWIPDGVPIPTVPSVDWERVQSIAQQNWQDSVNWAGQQYELAKDSIGDQYESAKVAIGAAEPTPSTYLEGAEQRAQRLLDQAKHNYYAGVGLAHGRYSEFLSSASSAVNSLTATPTPTDIKGSASSAASVANESIASAASAAGEAVGNAGSAATDAAGSVLDSVTGAASEAGDKVAENWDFVISQVSSQVYGAPTPTPWYQNLYEAAGGYAEAAGEAAGDYASAAGEAAGDYASAAGGYAASATDAAADQYAAVTSAAGDYASSAGDAASSNYAVVSSLISELVVGKEPTFTESVYSRLAGAYSSGTASALSIASGASETAANAASGATDAVRDTLEKVKDEL